MEKDVSKCPPYRLISSAANGDEKAIQKILDFYDNYISACCMRKLYDEYGNEYYCVDETLRSRLEAKLLKTVLGFKMVR